MFDLNNYLVSLNKHQLHNRWAEERGARIPSVALALVSLFNVSAQGPSSDAAPATTRCLLISQDETFTAAAVSVSVLRCHCFVLTCWLELQLTVTRRSWM